MVKDAAAAIGLPLSGFNPRSPYSVAGRPILPLPQRPLANLAIVSDDYFTLLPISFVAGRAFTEDNREGAPASASSMSRLPRASSPAKARSAR